MNKKINFFYWTLFLKNFVCVLNSILDQNLMIQKDLNFYSEFSKASVVLVLE
jgi:hypothetical protein